MADKRLNDIQKIMYGRILGLSDKYGYCNASNEWLGNQVDKSAKSVSRIVSELQSYGLIEVHLEKKGIRSGADRKIYPTVGYPRMGSHLPTNREPRLPTNGASLSNRVLTNRIREMFDPPSLEEVKTYCLERKRGVDPERWWNFYQAKGWMVGKNKMKDWKAAVRTWEEPIKQNTEVKNKYAGI